MSEKQGGKGETSSASRKASHQRGPLRTAANAARKIARHVRKMGLTKVQQTAATLIDPFNGAPKARRVNGNPEHRAPLPMRALREIPLNNPPGFVIANGVILEASPRASDLAEAFQRASSRPCHLLRLDALGVLRPIETKAR